MRRLAVSFLLLLASTSFAADLVLLPGNVHLPHKEARQRLVAQWKEGDRFLTQAHDVAYTSADEKICTIENGVLIPHANGRTEITARSGEKSAKIAVDVTGQEQSFAWSFRNHVESVLSKQGCNGGACHGARAGQKGFRLALFGFDVDADYNYLTRQAGGRRITPADPGRSLLLTKPTGLLPHKGGVRLEPNSLEYRVLAEWIAGGTPGPRDDDPRIAKLEVEPRFSTQAIGLEQQLLVTATFTDGRKEDVTRWSKFTVTNSSVASIDPYGKLKITGSGETAVNVWYLNLTSNAFAGVPYTHELSAGTLENMPEKNWIDRYVNAKLASLRIPASPPCDDSTFLRRASLDTIGLLPTPEELADFLANAEPNKREQAIEKLLARPEFVDYWTYQWSDLLLINGEKLRPEALKAFNKFVRESVAANKPWDVFAREVVTAVGSTHENGAANFYSLHQDPEDVSETVAQAFMGLSINCAKCHNHPLEKWTNDQYYAMANMFSRVRAKGWGGDFRSGDGLRTVFSDTQGELIQPSRGKPQPPQPLDGTAMSFDDPSDRRVPLAAWLTATENPYFTRSIANRVWANFFSTGLVEKVDDMRASNPPSNEELLGACAKHLIENKYDLKSLMRAILNSAAYQRSSESSPLNKFDATYFSHSVPRRLSAEVLLDAVSQATGVPTEFKDQPKGMRALQLADSNIVSYFLDSFGRPDRQITCDCERSDEPSMPQVLHLFNGDTLNKKLQAKESRIAAMLEEKVPPQEIVERLYRYTLARNPTEKERTQTAVILAQTAGDQLRETLEDVQWSLLTSREFLFQH